MVALKPYNIFLIFSLLIWIVLPGQLNSKARIVANSPYKDLVESVRLELASLSTDLLQQIQIHITSDPTLTAETDGHRNILIAESLIRYHAQKAATPREAQGRILYIIAHEFAHILMHQKLGLAFSPKCETEKAADAYAGLYLLALGYSIDIPTQIFQEMAKTQEKRPLEFPTATNGCHINFRQREYLWLQNLGAIKESAYLFDASYNLYKQGTKEALLQNIEILNKIRTNMATYLGDLVTNIDFALALSYHKLWLGFDNDPQQLLVQISLYQPAQFFRIQRAGADTIIPGNQKYFYLAKKHYELHLKAFRDRYSFINYALLLMYETNNLMVFDQVLEHLEKISSGSDSKYLNNLGSLYLFQAARIGNQYDFLADRKKKFLNIARTHFHRSLQLLENTPNFIQPVQMRNKIYYNLTLLHKLLENQGEYTHFLDLYKKENLLPAFWLKNIEATSSFSDSPKVKRGSISSILRQQIPFAPNESYASMMQKVSILTPSVTMDTREAGGWMFVRLLQGKRLTYRLIFRPDAHTPGNWSLQKVTYYYHPETLPELSEIVGALGKPEHSSGNELQYRQKGIEVRYQKIDGKMVVHEISLQ